MKRLVFFAAAGLIVVTAFGTAEAAKRQVALKTAICHRTKSNEPGKAYTRIVVTTKTALAHHRQHPQDIIPASGACPKRGVTPTSGGTVLTARMVGAGQFPPGDSDGTGRATIRTISGTAYLCFVITVRKIQLPATAAHIHKGPARRNGNVVVALKAPDASGKVSGCVNVKTSGAFDRTLVKAILADPSMYYVNVHTTDHPAGAVRGQLSS